MTSLTFRLPGAGRPATVSSPSFHTLLSLRLALESRPSFHSSLSRLRLEPIPLTYLPALRFAGGAAYTRADWMTGRVWSTLRILVIHLTPPQRPLPGGHSEDAKVGGKVLHDYLSSFSETLEELSVHWIGSCGANVLFLEESTGWDGGRDFSAPQLTWRRLKRLLLGGMGITVDQVRRLFTERATELRSLRIERGILADGVEEAYNKLAMAALSWRTYREGDTYTTEVWSNESFNQRKSDRGGWEGQGDGDANVGYIPIILQYASF
ncbi:MAG: hypothetical protein M1833_005686 [Piccolia ochrophora]|nr:MAG: hypothetical protein M1833_005686 [Piccolia ochrophora]